MCIRDSFDPLYDEVCRNYPEHKTVVADSAYKTPWICKRIFGADEQVQLGGAGITVVKLDI